MTAFALTVEVFEAWLADDEDENLEFKEAKSSFDKDKLTRYCVALANEGGGRMVFGVTDSKPRKVVGTSAFRDLSVLKRDLGQRLHLRIDADTLEHPDGRVVVVTVPPRPIGSPIEFNGAYWMRRGEDLVAMSPEVLRQIFDEGQPDYSALVCPGASIEDLDTNASDRLRSLWRSRSKNDAVAKAPLAQLLEDAELTLDGKLTYAALILLGSRQALGRYLPQAETIFEYRSSEGAVTYNQREEFREGFLSYLDRLWELIQLRNEVHLYQEGLFRFEISTFNEAAVREALLNALCHRDYRLGGSIFVRQFPKRIEIVSPGGFPPGITMENLLWRQSPRNRRVAEVMAKCGLVERSGQGANRIYESCIQEGKALPDYTDSDEHQVSLVLNGEVQDERFLLFLERVGVETRASFSTDDFLILDLVHRDVPLPDRLKPRLPALVNLGVVESRGRGRGTRYLLSERFYRFADSRGTYTRKKGLDKDTNKALLLKHLRRNQEEGSPLRDLRDVLPALSGRQIQHLLNEMKAAGDTHSRGRTRAARWYPGPAPDEGQGS